MIARRKFRTKEARKRERIKLALILGGSTITVLLLLWGVVYGSQMDSFRLKHIYVDVQGVLTDEQIATVLETELDGKFIGLFPKDSVFAPSHAYLTDTIKKQYPRVEHVQLDRLGLYTLKAEIEEYTPDGLWCGDLVPPIAQRRNNEEETVADNLWGTCYLMSESGYIYAKAPLYSDNVFPRYYGSLENAEPIGQFFIDSERFKEWQRFYRSVSDEHMQTKALLFVDERDAELYLSNGLKVLVPRQENLDSVESRLTTILHSGEIEEEKEVAYIDMRFGNKAFIKYVEETEEN